jgi:hypothetical protein
MAAFCRTLQDLQRGGDCSGSTVLLPNVVSGGVSDGHDSPSGRLLLSSAISVVKDVLL